MANVKLACPKCKSAMEEGFTLDRGHHNTANVSYWIEGSPDKRWWGMKAGDKVKLEITTFRCVRCGYLESYALPPQA